MMWDNLTLSQFYEKYQGVVEYVGLAQIQGGYCHLYGDMCSGFLSNGCLDPQFKTDRIYANVNIDDYITPMTYFVYIEPSWLVDMSGDLCLNKSCESYLENSGFDIYKVELHTGLTLRDLCGDKHLKRCSMDCRLLERLGKNHVKFNIHGIADETKQMVYMASSTNPFMFYMVS